MDNRTPDQILEGYIVAYRAWRYLDDEVKPLLMDRDAAARRLREATLEVVTLTQRLKLQVRPIGGSASTSPPRPVGLPA
jgi:hypothetical protein